MMILAGSILTDPADGHVLVGAADWVRSLLLGSTATMIATLAVAAIGFGMLQGRLPFRRGLVVTMGCFVIFGATAIAQGLVELNLGAVDREPNEPLVASASTSPAVPAQPEVYDPYAGASVPVR